MKKKVKIQITAISDLVCAILHLRFCVVPASVRSFVHFASILPTFNNQHHDRFVVCAGAGIPHFLGSRSIHFHTTRAKCIYIVLRPPQRHIHAICISQTTIALFHLGRTEKTFSFIRSSSKRPRSMNACRTHTHAHTRQMNGNRATKRYEEKGTHTYPHVSNELGEEGKLLPTNLLKKFSPRWWRRLSIIFVSLSRTQHTVFFLSLHSVSLFLISFPFSFRS